MSRSLGLAALSRGVSVVVCGLALASSTACHQRSSGPGRPSTPEEGGVHYGQRPGEEGAGAVQSLTTDDLGNVRVKRVEELLAGRFAGVRVLPAPGGGFSIRVRAAGSAGDGEPLFVVDGMPVEVTPGRGLDWLDPADVARIDVLKNAAETSMYGGRGANGVILIFTKRSNQRGSPPRR